MEQAGEVVGYVDDGRFLRIGSEGRSCTNAQCRPTFLAKRNVRISNVWLPGFLGGANCVVYRIGNAAATWELVGAGSLLKRPPRGVSKYHVRVDFPPEGTCLPLTP
ncbi:hypothetical protein M513_12983 [Trichuris suis]|uniref:Uncharacterized protein n=1 Tax=Trichuris suis TaxID=68888 RepID=A0A085LME5_9BILA|nr:hypothetical protein M513_12983 [Trichuris suis]